MGKQPGLTRGQLLDLASGYWQTCALHAAVALGIFSVIGDQNLDLDEVVERSGLSRRGAAALLNGLVAMRILAKSRGKFVNTESSRIFLVEESPEYVGHIILHHHHLVDGWARLDQAVKSGRPVAMRSYGEERERRGFQLGMYNMAMGIAPELAKQVDLAGRKRLLDLGGGPGTYAIHFCLANPDLQATVYDLPTTRQFAVSTIERFGLADRVSFVAGDFHQDPIKGVFDVAWLSHILHSSGPDACERLLAKVVAALAPGGLIMIHEFFLNDSMDGPLFPALFSLNMLVNNVEGRSYSEREMRAMLKGAGITGIERLPFQGRNDSFVLCGVAG